jgi:hypothetical protein
MHLKFTNVKYPSMFVFLAVFLLSCGDQQARQKLEEREKALTQRELEFAAKAADYQALQSMRDRLLSKKADTVVNQQWPEGIEGTWNGKLMCRESDCSDYVVGDQRSDNWVFASDSTSIFTKIVNKEKLVRVFSAEADSTEIKLHFKSDSTANRKVDIRVVLTPAGTNLIKGTQTISVNDNCTARFSVELVRATNP